MAEDIWKSNDIINQRWVIKEKLGAGGYGQIYRAKHREDLVRTDVAIKVGVGDTEMALSSLQTEAHVLRKLKGHKHFCDLIEVNRDPRMFYLVMTALNKTLSELRRMMDGQFSVSTSFRVSVQILKCIDDVHALGFVHRDVKPSNFMTGRPPNAKEIYMIDFGLARKHISDLTTGAVKKPREYCGFRGTVRYASIATHESQELGRKDDLWSMFYMMIEFLTGHLPWHFVKEKDEVGEMKKSVRVEKMTEKMDASVGLAMRSMHDHLTALEYETKPDYLLIRNLLTTVLTEQKCQIEDDFDWEKGIFEFKKLLKPFQKSGGSTKFSKSQQHASERFEFNDGEEWNDEKKDATGVAPTPSATQLDLGTATNPSLNTSALQGTQDISTSTSSASVIAARSDQHPGTHGNQQLVQTDSATSTPSVITKIEPAES